MKPAILIIDDSLTVRMDLDEAFAAAGFATTSCASLATARQALASSAFALVVLDVQLPDGDGIDLLRELRQDPLTSKVPVLMLSTEAEVHDRVRALRSGADDYVGKPYDLTYVLTRTRELLRSLAPATAPAPGTVLLIDDSPTFREALSQALTKQGHAVVSAASGEEGLRLAAQLRPALLVIDGMLPGIDGHTVIRCLREDQALRRTSCVLLTGSEGAQDELRALDAGADVYLLKSLDLGILVQRLSALVRAGEQQGGVGHLGASLIGSKRILAVDDSPTHLHAVTEQLRDQGYEVIAARSGESALELLAVQPVDCILLDLNMPGLSGQETCRRIKQSPALRDIPLVIMTATEAGEALIASIDAGADDCISKGAEVAVIRARLRAQLRRKQFNDETRALREQLLRREKLAAEIRSARELAEARARVITDLERRFKELEAFSYSASHDLQAPLRCINGFSKLLLEEYSAGLDDRGREYLQWIAGGARQMSELIKALLALSRVSHGEIQRQVVDLGSIAREVIAPLRLSQPERQVELVVEEDLTAEGDAALLRIALANLLGNAWKYTAKRAAARIEIGSRQTETERVFSVCDNGVGFDMAQSHRLFGAFQRLHRASEFEGTGIGLATVQRIIERHRGRTWAEGKVDAGATFFFTLPSGQEATRPYHREPGNRRAR